MINTLRNKMKIIQLFNQNVKNVKIECKSNHYGSEGHWLESKFGLKPNGKNSPDIFGFELKKESKKITIGDFSAKEYLFSPDKSILNHLNNMTIPEMKRCDFIKIFGNPNPLKNNRYSWSGSCVPKYGKYNECGQILKISNENDVFVEYSFYHDKRERNIPDWLKEKPIVIAIWNKEKLKHNIENKFNQKGFIICKKENGVYSKICFGKPFNYEYFLTALRCHKIFFDSGMYQGNTRNYSQFRGTYFWDELIVEEY